ncbi:hypothetical protein [Pelagibacterium xiamenense]|uniref:hypothetical protein n=1 Tax=Pelagibacterium xiamenense TaxID=2901140 RepID=UPI001E5227F1|nr:hypothetical protein [Pelagibacterium xiamenense]MCD7060579.1 hypothetical protein [Pelagibacterium xiamenense]
MNASFFQRWSPCVVALGAAVGLIISIINYFTPGNGISGTPGALLVIGSTLAILLAATVIWFLAGRLSWIGGTLFVLILLGILGTAFAGYLLESAWLPVTMAVCLAGWLTGLVPAFSRATA